MVFELKKADVSGAFLTARLHKAGNGLVISPKEWVESACDGMKEVGFVQSKTDPCVWMLIKETSQSPRLQVLVLFHIDDFMLAGCKSEAGWEKIQQRMRNSWK